VRRDHKLTSKSLLPKAIVPILTRTIAFLCLFVIISGAIGPHIISHGLVNKDGFQIYGGAGKALLFATICLLILVQRKPAIAVLKPWHLSQLVWLILMILSASTAWYSVNQLIGNSGSAGWAVLANVCLIASIIFAAGASFGPSNLRLLFRAYKKELIITLGLVVAFYIFLTVVYGLWQVLATVVLHIVSWLLHLCGLTAVILPPRTLLLSKFGIDIAQYCSGIESIALFTGLYVLIGVLDWNRLKHQKFLYIFPLALLILFALNILRVFVLILAGYYINPHIAFSLFHTYAGMVFFIIYSAIFWAVSYKRLLTSQTK
jgi:exosortase/archaeosortase family protein